jgi:NADH:ubiquinone oxidoreductase subunit F (NADH-binding)
MSLLPRILAGVTAESNGDLRSHLAWAEPLTELRRWTPDRLIDEVERSGLRGRGGAAFPVARKMRAVAARRGPRVIVGNGTEGEPASGKDRLLLTELPHLVLDGAATAARAVNADTAIIAFSQADDVIARSLRRAIDERRRSRSGVEPRYELHAVEDGFVSGQESALVNALSGAEPRPGFRARPFERGVRRRPTLVQNVETLAHLALIVRHGAGWYRQAGTAADPGSTLVTLSGAIASPGVYEIEHGAPLSDLLASADQTEELAAVLIGGYFGSWLPAPAIPQLRLSATQLAEHGAALGAGAIVALGRSVCPVAEISRVAAYFAAESAGQCGPCVNRLAAIADTTRQIVRGTASAGARRELERWSNSLAGRGACQFPDGATRFVASALRVFADGFEDHLRRGPCEDCAAPPVLPVPPAMT